MKDHSNYRIFRTISRAANKGEYCTGFLLCLEETGNKPNL